MADLIGRCAAARPHPDWVKLAALPYSHLGRMAAWMRRPYREEPPAKPLKGLWFGLHHPCPGERNPVADIYVAGSERFEADPADNDWAVGAEWTPESGAAGAEVLAVISRIANWTDFVGEKTRAGLRWGGEGDG
jgi:hypothetical protein